MLSLSNPKRAQDALAYFEDHLRMEPGMASEAPAPGRWLGLGSRALNLSSQVTADELARVLLGTDPTGSRRLVTNAGAADRRAGWDLCMSAPKSVSLAWAFGDPMAATAIVSAHQQAVAQTVDRLEQEWTLIRRGHGGVRKEHAQCVAAVFTHFSSRELDPQIHDHVFQVNLGMDATGHWGALEPRPIFQVQLAIGAEYRRQLAQRMEQLGWDLEPDGEFFRLAAIPVEWERLFSRRRAQIEEALVDYPNPTARVKELAALRTRSAKRRVPLEDLRSEWSDRLALLGSASSLDAMDVVVEAESDLSIAPSPSC